MSKSGSEVERTGGGGSTTRGERRCDHVAAAGCAAPFSNAIHGHGPGGGVAEAPADQWQGLATKDPSLLEKIARLTFLRDKARIEQAIASVKQLFSSKLYGHLLRTGEGTQSLCVYADARDFPALITVKPEAGAGENNHYGLLEPEFLRKMISALHKSSPDLPRATTFFKILDKESNFVVIEGFLWKGRMMFTNYPNTPSFLAVLTGPFVERLRPPRRLRGIGLFLNGQDSQMDLSTCVLAMYNAFLAGGDGIFNELLATFHARGIRNTKGPGLGLFDCKFWLNNPVSLMNTELSQLKPEELALVKKEEMKKLKTLTSIIHALYLDLVAKESGYQPIAAAGGAKGESCETDNPDAGAGSVVVGGGGRDRCWRGGRGWRRIS